MDSSQDAPQAILSSTPALSTPTGKNAPTAQPRRSGHRAKTVSAKISRAKLVKLKRENAASLSAYPGARLPAMPRTLGDCISRFGLTDPCPYARCRHHLGVDVLVSQLGKAPSLKINFPEAEAVTDLRNTCSLRSAMLNPDGQTLEEVAKRMNVTRERARQIEYKALRKLRGGMQAFHPSDDYDDHFDDDELTESETLEAESVEDERSEDDTRAGERGERGQGSMNVDADSDPLDDGGEDCQCGCRDHESPEELDSDMGPDSFGGEDFPCFPSTT
jgi:hypothetical protein